MNHSPRFLFLSSCALLVSALEGLPSVIVARAGYECPAIITPEDFFNRQEEFEI